MEPIQVDVMEALAEVDRLIEANPTKSVKRIYDEEELLEKWKDQNLVSLYWPEFETKNSAYFAHKNKYVLKLPTGINDLKDLPDDYKLTTVKCRFLASPIEAFSRDMLLASLIGLTILSQSEKWWCDGTFKTAPKFYYQHYIIHGKYKNKWPLCILLCMVKVMNYTWRC